MAFSPGDHVLVEAESTDRAARRGVVEEVVRDDPHPRYRIRWEDGHESIYTPAAGALKLAEPAGRSAYATEPSMREPRSEPARTET